MTKSPSPDRRSTPATKHCAVSKARKQARDSSTANATPPAYYPAAAPGAVDRHQLVFCAPAATEYPGRAEGARKRCVSSRATTGGLDYKESRQSSRASALDMANPPQFHDKTSNRVGGPGLPARARRVTARGRHSAIPASSPSDAPAVVDGAHKEEGPPTSLRTTRGTRRRFPARPEPPPDPPASLRGGGPGKR